MESLLIMLSVVLFFILLSAMAYMIVQFGDVSTIALVVMATIMIVAVGAIIFMSMTTIFSNYTSLLPQTQTTIQILNVSLCDNIDMPCTYSAFPEDNNVTIYWTVDNGVGCCATYNCDYTLFTQACLEPFTLYDIYLDNNKNDWSTFNMTQYDYNCSYVIPWNYFYFTNVTLGLHTINIEQKDCTTRILATANITFNLSQIGQIYTLEVVR